MRLRDCCVCSPTGKSTTATDTVLEIVAYEARRLFRDRIVTTKDLNAFDNILVSVIRGDWGSDVLDNMSGKFIPAESKQACVLLTQLPELDKALTEGFQ